MNTVPHEWQLQEAKNKLSQVVHLAIKDGPQIITLHGRRAVIIISVEEYDKLAHPENSLSDFLRQSPLMGVKLDLKRSKDTGREGLDL